MHGGFEGNGQTLRLLTKVENSYGIYGLDLTRRCFAWEFLNIQFVDQKSLPGNYPIQLESMHKTIRINDWLPPKAYFDCEQTEVDWLLSPFSEQDKTLFQSLAVEPHEDKHGKSAYHSFDCSIMDAADDIAYGVHDLKMRFIYV